MIRFNGKAIAVSVIAGLMAVAATARAGEDKTELVTHANATQSQFLKTDPGLETFFTRSAGYVIFPSVGKGAFGVGGAYGSGVVYDHGQPVGRAKMTQVTVGAQAGGQEYSEVIFFETPAALHNFMSGQMELSGQASAVALKSGASANAKYRDGVAVVTATKGGLMFEASVGGQKFSFEPFARKR
jgi:lipid-binding SYLF domain-containing protein